MAIEDMSRCQMDLVELEGFLKNPPRGFTVEQQPGTGHRFVKSDPESCLVLIDDFMSYKGKVVFQRSLGKKIKVHNLGDYTRVRKSLTSKKIYLLVSACEDKFLLTNKTAKDIKVLQWFVVAIDGRDPVTKWELERGLDWTISSVAGESYRVDIDLMEALRARAGEGFCIITSGQKVKPVWRDTSFTLKYYSDALFDFPHWLGFSKRQFKIACHGRWK